MNRFSSFAGVPLLAGLVLLATPLRAELITLESLQDNTLIESVDGSLSFGAGDRFFAGRTNQGSNSIRRGVVAFDVASSIPAGSLILSASLQLTQTSSNGPGDVSLHRLQSDWGEGTSTAMMGSTAPSTTDSATWLHTFYTATFWTSPGGDFDPSASAVTAVDIGASTTPMWASATMTSDVQGWLDSAGGNFGWILIGDESTNQTTQAFASRERGAFEDRPKLVVEYYPPRTVTLPSVADTTLIEGTLMDPRALGGSGTVFGGATMEPAGKAIRRALLRFDVDSVLPDDAMIETATLELTIGVSQMAHSVDVHVVTGDWGEGTEVGPATGMPPDPGSATWFHRFFDTDFWTSAGGDFVAAPSAQTFVDQAVPGSATWTSAQLAADVQAWVDMPASDFGWMLRGDEVSSGTVTGYASSENSVQADRPRLVIEYIPEPTAMSVRLAALLGVAFLGLLRSVSRRDSHRLG